MSIKATLTKHAFLIVTALVFKAAPISAALVPAPLPGDVFAGFRASAGTGAGSSYLVNLGQLNTFVSVSEGSSITVANLGDIGADLSATAGNGFGSNWHSRTEVSWGVFGRFHSASPAVYCSRARPSISSPSVAWSTLPTTARQNVSNRIGPVLEGIGGYLGLQATSNSPVGAFQENSSSVASYNFQLTDAPTDFGNLSRWSNIEANFSNGVGGALLDFYVIEGSTVTRIGYFSISESGVITFTRPSTPPPANLDTDGDGFTDIQENLAGTSVTDPADFFRVQNVQHSAAANSVSYKTVVGRTYKVQYSLNLAADWQDIDTYTETTGATLRNFLDQAPARTGEPRGFYRVIVSQ